LSRNSLFFGSPPFASRQPFDSLLPSTTNGNTWQLFPPTSWFFPFSPSLPLIFTQKPLLVHRGISLFSFFFFRVFSLYVFFFFYPLRPLGWCPLFLLQKELFFFFFLKVGGYTLFAGDKGAAVPSLPWRSFFLAGPFLVSSGTDLSPLPKSNVFFFFFLASRSTTEANRVDACFAFSFPLPSLLQRSTIWCPASPRRSRRVHPDRNSGHVFFHSYPFFFPAGFLSSSVAPSLFLTSRCFFSIVPGRGSCRSGALGSLVFPTRGYRFRSHISRGPDLLRSSSGPRSFPLFL